MKKVTFDRIISGLVTAILVILVTGIPVIFTAYTRSVFEINKFLFLRICTLVVMGLWFFNYLILKNNNYDNLPEESYSIFGFRWKKIGFELPMLCWFGFNLLSTIFSQSFQLSVIGAYDRWEGIFSVINYGVLWFIFAKWVKTIKQFHWIAGGILISSVGSAIYGVFQSFGLDFMHWSVDASQRVFACINNPVHFCAYMAMVVMLCLGWMMYFIERYPNLRRYHLLFWGLLACISILYYAQFLSFSRATWLGFCAAISFFYLSVFHLYDKRTSARFVIDFFVTIIGLSSLYMIQVFKVYLLSPFVFGLALSMFVAYGAYSLWVSLKQSTDTQISRRDIFILSVSVLTLGVCFLVDFPEKWWIYGALSVACGVLIAASWRMEYTGFRTFLARIVILVMFSRLQFLSSSFFSALVLHLSLLVTLFFLLRDKHAVGIGLKGIRIWLLCIAFLFGFILILPSIPSQIHMLFSRGDAQETVTAVQNAKARSEMYTSSIGGQSARISMWKSAVPWIKDYWLIGSGLDTVKYMYPKYRRSDYGILEGGHNFTPDRLHNEYINSFATRGVPATFLYYGVLILGWYIIVLRAIYARGDDSKRLILLGVLCAATVYLGQVLFNFGVVATLFLFYVVIGLGHALSIGETDVNF